MNPKVDFFFNKAGKWREAYALLRMIAIDSELIEDLKWGCPCYTLNGKNVVLIHGFKDYCAFLFIKGALMKDKQSLLIQQSENVQSGRQIRFENANEILELELTLKAYINEAIQIEKSGLKVELKVKNELIYPIELTNKFKDSPELKLAFESLTPGRQRAYNLFFSSAKQSKTIESRIDKCFNAILSGKGLGE